MRRATDRRQHDTFNTRCQATIRSALRQVFSNQHAKARADARRSSRVGAACMAFLGERACPSGSRLVPRPPAPCLVKALGRVHGWVRSRQVLSDDPLVLLAQAAALGLPAPPASLTRSFESSSLVPRACASHLLADPKVSARSDRRETTLRRSWSPETPTARLAASRLPFPG